MDKSVLVNRLCFAHNMIVASIPLLEFAAARVDGELKSYFEQHAREESGHDAVLMEDLKALGVTEVPLNIEALETVGAQYYLVAHVHPSALLGYMAALERESVHENEIEQIEKAHSIKLKCLRLHAKLDVQHIKDLDAQIASLPGDLREIAKGNEMYVASKINKHFLSVES